MSSQEWAERAEAAEVSGDEHYAEYCLARHMEALAIEVEAEDLARFYGTIERKPAQRVFNGRETLKRKGEVLWQF